MPLQNDDLTPIFWLGRIANAAAFGKAWDVWRNAQADPKSLESKLQARFNECSVTESRTGYNGVAAPWVRRIQLPLAA